MFGDHPGLSPHLGRVQCTELEQSFIAYFDIEASNCLFVITTEVTSSFAMVTGKDNKLP